MIFTETKLKGSFLIDPERRADDRGYFARTWCCREFEAQGLVTRLVQTNVAYNLRAGTLRGMHYQVAPHEETKLIQCTRGAIYDVILDLRTGSPTHGQWFAAELNDHNRRQLYIPRGFAHGYQTLTDDVEVLYQVSEFYDLACERGVRYDDPAFGISWPLEITAISHKDSHHPPYQPCAGSPREKAAV